MSAFAMHAKRNQSDSQRERDRNGSNYCWLAEQLHAFLIFSISGAAEFIIPVATDAHTLQMSDVIETACLT